MTHIRINRDVLIGRFKVTSREGTERHWTESPVDRTSAEPITALRFGIPFPRAKHGLTRRRRGPRFVNASGGNVLGVKPNALNVGFVPTDLPNC